MKWYNVFLYQSIKYSSFVKNSLPRTSLNKSNFFRKYFCRHRQRLKRPTSAIFSKSRRFKDITYDTDITSNSEIQRCYLSLPLSLIYQLEYRVKSSQWECQKLKVKTGGVKRIKEKSYLSLMPFFLSPKWVYCAKVSDYRPLHPSSNSPSRDRLEPKVA